MKEGGLAVLRKYGVQYFSDLGKLPPKPGNRRRGRPTKEEAVAMAWEEWEEHKMTKKGRRGKKGGWGSDCSSAPLFEIKTQ
ncbi:MAG: hypothetical protein HOC20_12755 [Chloroflexi bacterium]|jgi:hypothetical protein|nr:hypothetical protein [Chloroflexota bacterium]